MSENTPNLKLPYILAAQAQKHVTHNEAIRSLDTLTQLTIEDRDLTSPPASPGEGDCYIIAAGGSGDWAGKDGNIAAFQDAAWLYYAPEEGWCGWLRDEDQLTVFDGTAWVTLSGGGGSTSLNPASGGLIGINDTADSTNRLKVSAPASLFDHEGDDHQLKINKDAASDSASVLFQTNYDGRAEFGLTGDDDFHMKVSPDGTTFHEGIIIDKDTGEVSFPNTSIGSGSGDEWGDAVDTDIVPDADGTRDLGATATRFAETYTDALDVTNNIIVGGTVDGRDIASDGSKLDNIEASATADQTGAEIKSLYEAEADTNAFTDAEQTKLSGIETSATADQTGAEIKSLYEAEADTNAFTDADHSKLDAIEASADVTDATNVDAAGAVMETDYNANTILAATSDDTPAALTIAEQTLVGRITSGNIDALTATEVRTLLNVEDGATGDQTDEEIQDIAGAMFTGNTETRITATYQDGDGTIDLVVDDDLSNYDNSTSAFLTSVDASDLSVTSEAQGDVLYRGASGWARLAAGTSGQFLKTQGAAADPVWATLAGGGDLLASNNLSDVASASTARSNLGLEIGVDVAAAGEGGITTDLLALALRVADLEGDALGIIDGIADPFDDETDVDTGASSNQSYNGTDDLYTITGTIEDGGHSVGAEQPTAHTNIDRSWSVDNSSTINQMGVYLDSAGDVTVKIAKRNSAGNYDIVVSEQFAHTGSGWEDFTLTTPYDVPASGDYYAGYYGHTVRNFSSADQDTAYNSSNLTGTSQTLTEGSGFKATLVRVIYSASNNLTLQSNAFTADSTPTTARLLFQVKPLESITINTDVIGSVSRDGGTTFTTATLAEVIEYADGTKLYEDESLDISGQPSGTSMKWKLTTANNKAIEVSGVVLQWS